MYTILHSKDLAAIYRGGRSGIFKERKKWVSAKKLLDEARKSGRKVPLIFAPGENIWELTYWGILDDVKIELEDDNKWSTIVTVTNLTRIPSPRPNKTKLIVTSTGTRLPKDHIRPYVLVQTPSFLTKPRKRKK